VGETKGTWVVVCLAQFVMLPNMRNNNFVCVAEEMQMDKLCNLKLEFAPFLQY
jgi:hypothetical protein